MFLKRTCLLPYLTNTKLFRKCLYITTLYAYIYTYISHLRRYNSNVCWFCCSLLMIFSDNHLIIIIQLYTSKLELKVMHSEVFNNKGFTFVVIFHSSFVISTFFSLLQPPLVQAIFNRNADEVKLFLHKKDEVNALVCSEWHILVWAWIMCIICLYDGIRMDRFSEWLCRPVKIGQCGKESLKTIICYLFSPSILVSGPRAPHTSSCCCLAGGR